MKRGRLSASEFGNLAAVSVTVVVMLSVSIFTFESFDYMKIALMVATITSACAAFFSVYMIRLRERQLRQKRVFIIYSNEDKEPVTALVKSLRELGYNPWVDAEEISPGQKWEPSVLKGLADSAVALLIVSKNLNSASRIVATELNTAMATMRSRDESFSPVIPVRLDDSPVPDEVKDVHWVDLYKEGGLEQLDRGLKRVLGTA